MKTKFQKTILPALSILIIIAVLSSFKKNDNNATPDELKGTINISGAFALYPITVKWAQEFKKQHPNVVFNISAGGAGKGITDALSGLVDIGLASRDINPAEVDRKSTRLNSSHSSISYA